MRSRRLRQVAGPELPTVRLGRLATVCRAVPECRAVSTGLARRPCSCPLPSMPWCLRSPLSACRSTRRVAAHPHTRVSMSGSPVAAWTSHASGGRRWSASGSPTRPAARPAGRRPRRSSTGANTATGVVASGQRRGPSSGEQAATDHHGAAAVAREPEQPGPVTGDVLGGGERQRRPPRARHPASWRSLPRGCCHPASVV